MAKKDEELIEEMSAESTPTPQELGSIMKDVEIDKSTTVSKLDKKELAKAEAVEKATDDLYEEFGEFLKVKAEIIPDSGVKECIPTGVELLDGALGGGFPVGALSIIVGNPGSCKSMLAIQTMGNGQRKFPGCLASFLDSEEATTTARLASLGVRKPKIKPYTDVTIEKVFKHLETMCLFKEQKGIEDIPSVLCWDSIANTLSQKEREATDVNSVIGYKAKVLSMLTPKYVAKCSKYNIAWLAINQLRDQLSMGPFSAPKELRFLSTGKSLPGGTALKFNAFTLLEMKAKQPLDPDKYGFDGMLVTATTVKNKFMSPNVTVELIANFTKGFSNFWTNFNFMAKEKRLQTGAWNYLKSYPEKKFRTKDAETLYNEDPKFKEEFDKSSAECIHTEIITKYADVEVDES